MKGIYKLYKGAKLVYIGKSTTNMKQRVLHHININKDFDRAELFKIKNKSDIAVLETYLISKYKPMYNTEYNYKDPLSITFKEEEYLKDPIILKDELIRYKEAVGLRTDMEIIDLNIKEMVLAGISFEEIIQIINDLASSE